MKRKQSLVDRAYAWADTPRTPRPALASRAALLALGYIAGYKAAQRDARKNRTEETNGDYSR